MYLFEGDIDTGQNNGATAVVIYFSGSLVLVESVPRSVNFF